MPCNKMNGFVKEYVDFTVKIVLVIAALLFIIGFLVLSLAVAGAAAFGPAILVYYFRWPFVFLYLLSPLLLFFLNKLWDCGSFPEWVQNALN